MDLRCQPRAFLAFGLVPGLYILKDFLNSHKDKVACRDGLNGCKGTEVVCNFVIRFLASHAPRSPQSLKI